MRSIQIIILATLVTSCLTKGTESKLFEDLRDKENVVIILNNYKLDSIPSEIGLLKSARTLTISIDTLHGWTIYPPLSVMDQRIDSPPFKNLPVEITTLKNLKRLTIHELNVRTLPDGFDKLDNLEYLDLTMNKLIISNELDKLKGLKNLKYLALFGNQIDDESIEALKKEKPGIQIDYKIE